MRVVALCASLLLTAGASCGGSDDPDATPGTSPSNSAEAPPEESAPPVADVPDELIGLFRTVVTLEDLKRLDDPHVDHHPEEITGKQYLEIKADGTYVFYEDRPERPVIRGQIEAHGSELTFTEEVAAIPGFIPCPRPGTYSWNRTGDKLTFENVDDKCLKIGRIAIMISSPFREV